MTTISSLPGFGAQQTAQNSSARLQAAIARLVGLPGIFPTVDSVASLSTAAQLQAQNADIRQISGNIVQALSLSQVADDGAAQIQAAVQQLQSLAQQAQSSALSADNRAQLNTQFQQLASQINVLAKGTNFNGKSLLDGSLSGDNAISVENVLSGDQGNGGSSDLSIADLTAGGLLGTGLNLLSSSDAADAVDALSTALNTITSVRGDIGFFQQVLDYASANVDTALANQVAALSAIGAEDIAPPSANVQQNVASAISAQASQLSPALLKLVG